MAIFLSLDGLDGTGKSTQARLLVDRLRAAGHAVTFGIDPGGTDVGAKIREIVLTGRESSLHLRTEALLFMASRAELVDRVVKPALDRGDIVVTDRFTLANVVYQGHAGGLEPRDLWEIGRIATGGLYPDRTFVFDLPVEAAAARRGRSADRMESRGLEYQQRVRDGFLFEARRLPELFTIVDASPPTEVVHETVWRAVEELLSNRDQ